MRCIHCGLELLNGARPGERQHWYARTMPSGRAARMTDVCGAARQHVADLSSPAEVEAWLAS